MSHTPFVHFGTNNLDWTLARNVSSASFGPTLLFLYRHECFTGKYTTRKIHTKLHPRP